MFSASVRCNNFLNYFPVVSSSAAVKADDFSGDVFLFVTRGISTLALTTISLGALFWTAPAAPLLLTGTVCVLTLAAGSFWFEQKRTWETLDKLAVDHYCKTDLPRKKAVERICFRPEAFKLLVERKADLNKTIEGGSTLCKKVFDWIEPFEGHLQIQKMYIDACQDPFATDEVFYWAELRSPSSLKYLLESKKTAVLQNPQKQVEVWKQVKNPSTIELLCKHEFNINVEDEQGESPLMYWARRVSDSFYFNTYDLVVEALKAGANLHHKNQKGEKVSEVASGYSDLRELLKDTEEMSKHKPDSLPEDETFLRWLPWKPSACKGHHSYIVDQYDTFKLSGIIFLISAIWAAATIGTLLAFGSSSLPLIGRVFVYSWNALSLLNITGFFITLTNLWRNNKEAKRQAVIEYLTAPIPSRQAALTICQDMEAAQMLVRSVPKGSPLLNKYIENKRLLLTTDHITFEVFKLLIDHGADPLKTFGRFKDRIYYSILLHQVLHNNDPRFIDHLFASGHFSVSNMSPELKMHLWTNVCSKETAQVLLKQGLSPNDVRDALGDTPLMHIVCLDPCDPRVKILLEAGADPSLLDPRGKKAIDSIQGEKNKDYFRRLCASIIPVAQGDPIAARASLST